VCIASPIISKGLERCLFTSSRVNVQTLCAKQIAFHLPYSNEMAPKKAPTTSLADLNSPELAQRLTLMQALLSATEPLQLEALLKAGTPARLAALISAEPTSSSKEEQHLASRLLFACTATTESAGVADSLRRSMLTALHAEPVVQALWCVIETYAAHEAEILAATDAAAAPAPPAASLVPAGKAAAGAAVGAAAGRRPAAGAMAAPGPTKEQLEDALPVSF